MELTPAQRVANGVALLDALAATGEYQIHPDWRNLMRRNIRRINLVNYPDDPIGLVHNGGQTDVATLTRIEIEIFGDTDGPSAQRHGIYDRDAETRLDLATRWQRLVEGS